VVRVRLVLALSLEKKRQVINMQLLINERNSRTYSKHVLDQGPGPPRLSETLADWVEVLWQVSEHWYLALG